MIKLNEFSREQLQWILKAATMEMSEITIYRENIQKYGLTNVMKDELDERGKLFADLSTISGQVIDALADVTFKERVSNN